MTLEEIISSLEDQIADRESLIPKDEPDSVFAHDAQALREAVSTIRTLAGENERLRDMSHWKGLYQEAQKKAEAERDAAVRDLEEIMFRGGLNIDTCRYCSTKDCYGRGGYRGCTPKWRGREKPEEKTL